VSDRKENGTANHAEHAKGGGALQGEDDAFDLKAMLAEVSSRQRCKPVLSDNSGTARDGSREPRVTEFVCQCVFIDILKESSSQRVEHRLGAANNSFGQEVNPVLAGMD
jgi:hypothetical protein